MEATDKAQQELEQIERQVALIEATAGQNEATRRQLAKLQERVHTLRQEMKALQTAWQKTELARHPQRPQTLDYIERVFTDWSEIHGDRGFGDDPAIVCGMARFHGEEVLIVGTQKGRDMKQRVYRNFGTPHPEGYRKALRVMQVAEKFRRPIFTLVDTDGAYPGIHAEERGQAEAIAHYCDGHRGWGQRRRVSDRRRRPRADDGELDLFRHFPRGLCRHHVERLHQEGVGGRGDAHYGHGSE
jgi:acetyl-CoA carboxylase carboxyl transferase subunit alpha